MENLDWERKPILVHGILYDETKLSDFYGEAGVSYCYAKIKRNAKHWADKEPLLRIRTRIWNWLEPQLHQARIPGPYHRPNCVLLNYYPDGSNFMNYHSDDERSLGQMPIIISVSFGAHRRFLLRPKTSDSHNSKKKQLTEYILGHGSLFVMAGKTQQFYEHSVPKTSTIVGPRINLTYRHSCDNR